MGSIKYKKQIKEDCTVDQLIELLYKVKDKFGGDTPIYRYNDDGYDIPITFVEVEKYHCITRERKLKCRLV